MKSVPEFKILDQSYITDISQLVLQLNHEISLPEIETYLIQMFSYNTYQCFGLFFDDQLIGVSSGWITLRFYSGKQLEVDNVVIHEAHRSSGYGALFFKHIEKWAKDYGCKSVELNTYVHNPKSHKFYFNIDYKIIGYHFEKKVTEY